MTAAESSRKLIYLQMEVRRMYVVSFSLILVPVALCYTEGNALQGIGGSVLHEELISRLWTGAAPADKPCTHIESSFTRNWTICCRKKKVVRFPIFLGSVAVPQTESNVSLQQSGVSEARLLSDFYLLSLGDSPSSVNELSSHFINLTWLETQIVSPTENTCFHLFSPPKKNSEKFSLTSLFLLQFALGIGIARRSKIFWFLHRSSIPLELT